MDTATVAISGSKTDAGEYKELLVPNVTKIVDAKGRDVTSYYDISYEDGTLTITEAPTYTFDLNDSNIIKVNKKFVSKYGRSAEKSFTATVTIEKQGTYTAEVSPDLPINPNVSDNRSADNVEPTYEPTYTTVGKATGTVTLKTGTTKAFTFGENSKFQLQPCARTATGRCLKSKLTSSTLHRKEGTL